MTQPPEITLEARTDTQRTEDAIVTACTTIRDCWPQMIQPGETQAPGRVNPAGVTLDDHDQRESDTRRIDRVISHRRYALDVLAATIERIRDERPVSNPQSFPYRTDVPGMTLFIERQAEWLSWIEDGPLVLSELEKIAKKSSQFKLPPISDKPLPPKPHFIGRCPQDWEFDPNEGPVHCGGKVYAEQETVSDLTITEQRTIKLPTCRRCGTEADVDWWYKHMFPEVGTSHLVTTDELIGVIATRLNWVVTHARIHKWKQRGKIAEAGRDDKGRLLYRHDEVIAAVGDDIVREKRLAGLAVDSA